MAEGSNYDFLFKVCGVAADSPLVVQNQMSKCLMVAGLVGRSHWRLWRREIVRSRY